MVERLPLSPLLLRAIFALAAVLTVAVAPWLEESVSRPIWTLPLALALIAIGALSGLYRANEALGLGLGAMVLPVAIELVGPARSGLLAIATVGVRDLLIPNLPRNWLLLPSTRRRPSVGWWAPTARVALGALVAGWVWVRLDTREATDHVSMTAAAMSLLVFLLVQLVIEVIEERLRFDWRSWLPSASLELLGWMVGCGAVVIGSSTGLAQAYVMLLLVTVLSLDAVRLFVSRERIERELTLLKDASTVVRRGDLEMRGTVGKILQECSRIVPFHWFHLEVFQGVDGPQSWKAGDDRQLFDGIPTPPSTPPMLPGIHRRSSWKVLEFLLATESEEVGRLRLWCDPRQLDGGEDRLFATVTPQFATRIRTRLLEHDARYDELTGLPGRRALHQKMAELFDLACDEGRPMAVLIFDIDHFKKVNDTYGHAAGDEVLRHIANLFRARRRDGDLCCRFGGEEFVVVLDGTDSETAMRIAERFRREIERKPCRLVDRSLPITTSVGVAVFPEVFVSHPEDLLDVADKALYLAKDEGRNRSLLNLGGGAFADADGNRFQAVPAKEMNVPQLFA